MCDYSNREASMVVLRRDETGKPTVWCDPCIAPLVDALNTGDLATVAACCGHGRIPGAISLADGRQIVLLPDLEALNAFHQSHGKTINDPIYEPNIDWASDLTTRLEDLIFPFAEDENANLTGHGHQDKAAFADAVNRYDAELNGVHELFPDEDLWDADHIAYQWVTLDDVTETFTVVEEGAPGAIPVTTLWGAR